ncbi:hypothetical protein QC764_0061710 [Podospora pseudoanserina]|uniref:Uncharacterized protein n=1 Tax=Podospora pseudoanserina TaxID=2609844 RepID=A0ABR0I8S3_9PEZI|nr:hypothetical protein QC764_0061710 [Podospora pseudoanserina]
MAEVVELVVASNSLAKTCSTVWKLVELMVEIGRETPETVEREIRNYGLMLTICFTAVECAQNSLEARWPKEKSSCTPAMKYLRKNNVLRDIRRLTRAVRHKIDDLAGKTAQLPSSLQLIKNFKWHLLKSNFTALLPFMETLKLDLILAQNTLELEPLFARLESGKEEYARAPRGEMMFIEEEIQGTAPTVPITTSRIDTETWRYRHRHQSQHTAFIGSIDSTVIRANNTALVRAANTELNNLPNDITPEKRPILVQLLTIPYRISRNYIERRSSFHPYESASSAQKNSLSSTTITEGQHI